MHFGAHVLHVAACRFDERAGHAVFLTQHRVQQVQGVYLRIAQRRRVLNGVRKRFLRHLRELLFHIILHGSRPAARPSLPDRRSDAYVVV